MMNRIYERLFFSYGAEILNEWETHYDEDEIFRQLDEMQLQQEDRLRLEELFYLHYGRWSADAFAVGLHLGMNLVHDHVCRLRPQQGHQVGR